MDTAAAVILLLLVILVAIGVGSWRISKPSVAPPRWRSRSGHDLLPRSSQRQPLRTNRYGELED